MWVRQRMQDNCDSVPWQRRKPSRLELKEGPLVVRACPPFNDPVERKHVRSAKLPQTPPAIGSAVRMKDQFSGKFCAGNTPVGVVHFGKSAVFSHKEGMPSHLRRRRDGEPAEQRQQETQVSKRIVEMF